MQITSCNYRKCFWTVHFKIHLSGSKMLRKVELCFMYYPKHIWFRYCLPPLKSPIKMFHYSLFHIVCKSNNSISRCCRRMHLPRHITTSFKYKWSFVKRTKKVNLRTIGCRGIPNNMHVGDRIRVHFWKLTKQEEAREYEKVRRCHTRCVYKQYIHVFTALNNEAANLMSMI